MSVPPPGAGKLLSSPPSAPSHTPAPSVSSFDSGTSRRSNAQQSSGPATAAGTAAAPRKGQGARKQHRHQRRPEGNYHYRSPDLDDAMAEARALRNASSRRGQTSITHLLDYAAPSRIHLERASHAYRAHGSHGGYGGHHGHQGHHGYYTVDKARFVHANYRFVVAPTGDYRRQAADADEKLDWADVLQVLASAESQATACPICLSEPVAPRMATCGHIFCLACLIRFMHARTDDEPARGSSGGAVAAAGRPAHSVPGLAGTHNTAAAAATPPPVERKAKWKKCPICEDSIYLAEVRPVRFYAGQECPLPRPGDDVVLRLMRRHAYSTVALPRDGSGDSGDNGGGGIPWYFAANVLDYSRIMRGTGDYMVEQYDGELEALERQEREDELLFHEDGEWSQRAARAVRTAQEQARSLGGREVALPEGGGGGGNSGNSSSTPAAAAAKPARSLRPRDAPKPSQPLPQEDFFFYMAPPHLYLSPLDIRILKTKYGAFSRFPSTLLPRVEHLALGHTVDDALRRRAKYLGHLPAGCVVSFLECDWTDIVPAETLAAFADDLARRRTRNRDKAAQEDRERLQAERLELAAARSTRRLGAGAGGRIVGGTGRDEWDDWADGVGMDGVDGMDGIDGDSFDAFQPLAPAPASSPPNPRRGFGQLADLATSPTTATTPGGRTVWGTRAVAAAADEEDLSRAVDVDDGWLRAEQLLSDAELAAQLAALGGLGDASDAGDADGSGGGRAAAMDGPSLTTTTATGSTTATTATTATALSSSAHAARKKKKKQKITLMSTGGRRGL